MNSSTTWFTGVTGNYGFYSIVYEKPLVKDRLYFFKTTHKYTTTNAIPESSFMYAQGGAVSVAGPKCKITNPVANQENVLYGWQYVRTTAQNNSGNIYNGPSGKIDGVVGYVKNTMVYDITEMYLILKSQGVVTSEDTMAEWCHNNLEYKAPGVIYDVTSLLGNNTKTILTKGSIISEVVECDGMEYYTCKDEYRGMTYFDNGISPIAEVYNNKHNGSVTLTRVSGKDASSPFYPEHPYVVKITTNGEASPNLGGFYTLYSAKSNEIVVEKFVAKIPVGYKVERAGNTSGDYMSVEWLSSRDGTGEWEEYTVVSKYKSSGSFSSDGHIYLSANTGYSTTSVTWYLAYVNVCYIKDNEELKYYTALPKKDVIKGNKVFSCCFDTTNLIPNGTLEDSNMELPAGAYFDENDYAGNSSRSIVQPVGNYALKGVFGKIKINAQTRYKISYWVKCKGDMSSFLTAIAPFTENNDELTHTFTHYVNYTKTTLKTELKNGDTQMQVSSNANWVVKDYSKVGFRNWNDGWNKLGTFGSLVSSNGIVDGTSGNNIVLFKNSYTGDTMPVGTYVVESYDGGTYPYPINKNGLPTDNTWKYVEGYFGGEGFSGSWEGNVVDTQWPSLPKDTDYILLYLNIYTNNGSVPIKFCDIRIEEVGTVMGDGSRNENKIQFIKHN